MQINCELLEGTLKFSKWNNIPLFLFALDTNSWTDMAMCRECRKEGTLFHLEDEEGEDLEIRLLN